jgi:hypothetical protein
MRYATVNNTRTEASPGLHGVCPCCNSAVVAKCGTFKIWHWAHKSKEACDPWWESESDWHRAWKKCFPVASQEVIRFDDGSGEKHVADVLTPGGTAIEFQSYPMDEAEIESRELFWGKMVWVVNGRKNTFDKNYFDLSIERADQDTNVFNIYWMGRSKLMSRWAWATKTVYFDFGGETIWMRLGYDPKTKKGQMLLMSKKDFLVSYGGAVSATPDSQSAQD